MMKTLEEQRAFAREHLVAQAAHARAASVEATLLAQKHASFAAYCDFRAAMVEGMSDIEIALMIRDWEAGVACDAAASRTRQHWRDTLNLTARYDAPPPVIIATEKVILAPEKKEEP